MKRKKKAASEGFFSLFKIKFCDIPKMEALEDGDVVFVVYKFCGVYIYVGICV